MNHSKSVFLFDNRQDLVLLESDLRSSLNALNQTDLIISLNREQSKLCQNSDRVFILKNDGTSLKIKDRYNEC